MSGKIVAKYYGTEINEKWWKRYKKDGMFVRGNGTFSYNEQSISFFRLLNNTSIIIDFQKILEFKIGKWHAGQWGVGKPIIKILWKKDNQILSSGFSLCIESVEIEMILSELNEIKESNKRSL